MPTATHRQGTNMTEYNREATQKGSESLALILGIVSIPLSIILFGLVTGIAGCVLSCNSWKIKAKLTLKTNTALICSLLGIFGSLYFGYSYRQMFLRWNRMQENNKALIGQTVQPLHFTDIEGATIDTKTFHGEKIVVNLWSTTCPPCKREIPHFSKVATEMKGEVLFIGISPDTPELIRAFGLNTRISYPMVSEKLNKLPYPFSNIEAYPTTFIISKDHVIEEIKIGFLPEKTLRKWLEGLNTDEE
ncbi:MAG: hypothetical protein CR997_07545 [Acidobacteria bacterium]|nr:MAG: hypothetical protein CR997_07545 [Acidobacteriota bacterium]